MTRGRLQPSLYCRRPPGLVGSSRLRGTIPCRYWWPKGGGLPQLAGGCLPANHLLDLRSCIHLHRCDRSDSYTRQVAFLTGVGIATTNETAQLFAREEVLVVQRDICSGLRDRFVRDLGRRWALCSFERVDFGPAIQKIRSLVAWLSELM